jgi:transcriptional regulator GlxA family with amidase domain
VLDEVVADPGGDHRVHRLAERAAVSERHLARLFIAETGTTPARFVERARVEAARDMLEAGATPVETVANRAGFGSAETMRRAFLRVLGVGPADYRARFGGAPLRVIGGGTLDRPVSGQRAGLPGRDSQAGGLTE